MAFILGMPKEVKGYELLEQIGYGNFCNSYRVKKSGTIYFMKKYNSLKEDDLRREFIQVQREIKSATHDYDYCEKTLEDFEINKDYYQIKEFIQGTPANDYLEETNSFEKRIHYLVKMAENIQEIHKREIVHQDLKPEQFIINEEKNQTFIFDFDWSILRGKMLRSICTLPYKSPEHIKDETATYASDTFVFGMMLYYYLTGMFPFRITDLEEATISEGIMSGNPGQTPAEINNFIPASMSTLIMQMLSINQYKRPAMNDVVNELKRSIDNMRTKHLLFQSVKNPKSFYLIKKEEVELNFDRKLMKKFFKGVKDFTDDYVHYYFSKDDNPMFRIFLENSEWYIENLPKNRNYARKNKIRIEGKTKLNHGDKITIFSQAYDKDVAEFKIEMR